MTGNVKPIVVEAQQMRWSCYVYLRYQRATPGSGRALRYFTEIGERLGRFCQPMQDRIWRELR